MIEGPLLCCRIASRRAGQSRQAELWKVESLVHLADVHDGCNTYLFDGITRVNWPAFSRFLVTFYRIHYRASKIDSWSEAIQVASIIKGSKAAGAFWNTPVDSWFVQHPTNGATGASKKKKGENAKKTFCRPHLVPECPSRDCPRRSDAN